MVVALFALVWQSERGRGVQYVVSHLLVKAAWPAAWPVHF